jgi:hypothetical protein
MGGPEYSWLVYGWKVSRKLVVDYLTENKDKNNWQSRNKEHKFDEYSDWFFPENRNDGEAVEINTNGCKLYIVDEYNDHYDQDEMDVYISLIPKKVKCEIEDIINLPKELVDYGQKIANKLGSKETKPMLISAIEVHQ